MVGLEGVEGGIGLVVGGECEVGGRWHGACCNGKGMECDGMVRGCVRGVMGGAEAGGGG